MNPCLLPNLHTPSYIQLVMIGEIETNNFSIRAVLFYNIIIFFLNVYIYNIRSQSLYTSVY